jgi:hypothetical protein
MAPETNPKPRSVTRTLTLVDPALKLRLAAVLPSAPTWLPRWLGRAERTDVAAGGYFAGLARLVFDASIGDVPVAALTFRADSGQECSGWCLRADPVHLRIGTRRAELLTADRLELEPAQARALADSLGPILAAAGGRLEAPVASRWYLVLPRALDVVTRSPIELDEVDLVEALPGGPAGPGLRRLLNEMQMVLHAHPVNRERERRGALPVNSVWLWGEGRLPERWPRPVARLHGREPVLAGIAAATGAAWSAEVEPAAVLAGSGSERRRLVVLGGGLETESLRAGPDALAGWLRTGRRALWSGRISALQLTDARGMAFNWRRTDALRIWRPAWRPADAHA